MKNNQELIEKYILGELSEEEEQYLRKNMLSDKELEKEITLIDNIQDAISFDKQNKPRNIQLQQTIRHIEGDYFAPSPAKKVVPFRKSRRWLVAASLLLLIAIPLSMGKLFFSKEQVIAASYLQSSTNVRNSTAEWQTLAVDADHPQYLFYLYQFSEHLYDNKQFEDLKNTYTTLLTNQQNPKYDTKEINFELLRWNNLVINMWLNDEQTDRAIEELLQSDISTKYKDKALQLKQKRNHFLYQLFE